MVSTANDKWSRSPKHILRMGCLQDMTRNDDPAYFLEAGAGTGDFTQAFLENGYSGVCFDIGKETLSILRRNLESYGNRIRVVEDLTGLEQGSFDSLFLFEVLEHIENDLETLLDWANYVKSGGKIVLSVPAHQNKFSNEDARVGHVRRYEKEALEDLLTSAGFRNIKIYNYGFPLGNVTRMIQGLTSKKELEKDGALTSRERTIKSGIERADSLNRYSFLVNKITIFPFLLLQRLFYQMDWGDGYVATAIKS